jgi:predicted transcriptional regulator
LPAVKAEMAKTIVEKHGLNEQQAAKLLGLSQSAVSRYISKERGSALALDKSAEVLSLIDQMVTSLLKEPNNKEKLLGLFCQTCATVRHKGLMCPHCQKEMSKEWADNCLFCR